MSNLLKKNLTKDFTALWVVIGIILLSLIGYLSLCYFYGDSMRLKTGQPPMLLRTIFYGIAIISFPLTNLLRHIMLRLNQTMPIPAQQKESKTRLAKLRYFSSVLTSLVLAEFIGLLGLISFLMGDNCNTLAIFCLLSGLALFLYRPKVEEYQDIIDALDH